MIKKYTRKRYLLLFIFGLIHYHTANAQLWSVGTPVNMNLSTISRNGGGCYPNADFTFNIHGSQVTGVTFYAIVTACPANSIYMNPGMDTLAVGDSIVLASGSNTYSVFFFGGGGMITLDFRAIGTPTTAGQPYPCAPSNNWISNLGICPDGIQSTLNPNCAVDAGTGIANISTSGFSIRFPERKNDYLLTVNSNQIIRKISVINILGKEIIHADCRNRFTTLDCSQMSDGIYFVQIITDDGKAPSRKFVFNH